MFILKIPDILTTELGKRRIYFVEKPFPESRDEITKNRNKKNNDLFAIKYDVLTPFPIPYFSILSPPHFYLCEVIPLHGTPKTNLLSSLFPLLKAHISSLKTQDRMKQLTTYEIREDRKC